MKLLLDFLPILLFFGTFQYAENHPDWASAFATQHLGFLVSGGVAGPKEAPVLLATVVVILATLLQVAWLLARGKKVDTMLWVSAVLITVLGGATIWFHNDTFIKWKPSVLYWVMALSFWAAPAFFGKNLLQAVMKEVRLPGRIWSHLNWAWVLFFAGLGVLNLYVAYHFATPTWVKFKVFGVMGLILVFMVAQGVYLSRHLQPDPSPADAPPEENKSPV